MKKETKKSVFLDPQWQKKRLEIMQRDGFACKLCDNKERTLNVHHTYYDDNKRDTPWDYPDRCLITICDVCHEREHEELRNSEKELLQAFKKQGLTADYLSDYAAVIEEEADFNMTQIETERAIVFFLSDKKMQIEALRLSNKLEYIHGLRGEELNRCYNEFINSRKVSEESINNVKHQ